MSDTPVPVPLPPAGTCGEEAAALRIAEDKLADLLEEWGEAVATRDAAAMRAAHYAWNAAELCEEFWSDYDGEIPADILDLLGDLERTSDQIERYVDDPISNPFPGAQIGILTQDILGLIGDLIPLAWLVLWVTAYGALAEAALAEQEEAAREVDALLAQEKAARAAVSAARAALIDCHKHHRPCAVCNRTFDESDAHLCQGCGAWFCDAHYNADIEAHEQRTGVPHPP